MLSSDFAVLGVPGIVARDLLLCHDTGYQRHWLDVDNNSNNIDFQPCCSNQPFVGIKDSTASLIKLVVFPLVCCLSKAGTSYWYSNIYCVCVILEGVPDAIAAFTMQTGAL